MHLQEQGSVKFSLLALSCGLGKTLTCLYHILREVRYQQELEAKDPSLPKRPYAASLVLCPGTSVEVWMRDAEKFFPNILVMKQWFGSESNIHNAVRAGQLIPPSCRALQEFLDGLDATKPEVSRPMKSLVHPNICQTGLTVIVSAHQTWYKRTLATYPANELKNKHDVLQFVHADDEEDEEDIVEAVFDPSDEMPDAVQNREDVAAANERRRAKGRKKKMPTHAEFQEQVESLTKVWVCGIVYTFARVDVDEIHVYRNPRTFQSESVVQTQKRALHGASATPLLNHSRDLIGPLFQVWQPKWTLPKISLGYPGVYDPTFDPLGDNLKDETGPGLTNLLEATEKDSEELREQKTTLATAWAKGERLWVLNPRHYASGGVRSDWSAAYCSLAMKAILPMFMIRITYDTMISLGGTGEKKVVHVGASVPKAHFSTIMLQMNPPEQDEHDRHTDGLLKALNIGNSDDGERREVAEKESTRQDLENGRDGEGMVDNGLFRLLKHCTLDPNLAKLTVLNHAQMTDDEKVNKAKSAKNSWASTDNDCGASFYFLRTRDSSKYGVPGDRLSLAHYMTALSVKIRYLMTRLKTLVLEMKEKVILMFEFPMCLWFVTLPTFSFYSFKALC